MENFVEFSVEFETLLAMHHHQVLAMQQCSLPLQPLQLISCTSYSSQNVQMIHTSLCASRPALNASLRTQQCQVPRISHQRRRVSNSRTGADMEELEDVDLSQLDEEDLDALFEEYGEVVLTDGKPRPVASDVDDDAETLTFAIALAEAANEVKGAEIQVLFVKPLIYWARYFVLATAFSKPQVDAIGRRMRDMAEERFDHSPRGDTKPNSWTLLDFGDVVVHIFLPKERAYYNLEEFYGNATRISLPFENRVVQ